MSRNYKIGKEASTKIRRIGHVEEDKTAKNREKENKKFYRKEKKSKVIK